MSQQEKAEALTAFELVDMLDLMCNSLDRVDQQFHFIDGDGLTRDDVESPADYPQNPPHQPSPPPPLEVRVESNNAKIRDRTR